MTSDRVQRQLLRRPQKFRYKANCGQAARAISTGRLHPLLGFHLRPINQVVSLGPSGAGFPLPREA